MKIPPGVTFNVGRRRYGEGMELPSDAPENIKRLCAESNAALEKKGKEPEKPGPANGQEKPGEGGK